MNAPAFPIGAVPTTVSTGRRKLFNVRQQSLLVAKMRTLWILGVFTLIGLLAFFRVIYLGVTGPSVRGGDLSDLLVPQRGEIVDRNGVPLAREFRTYSLWFNPKAMSEGSSLIHTPAEVASGLIRIFPDLDRAELIAKLSSDKPGYLRKSILPEDANKVHALGEPALEYPQEATRFYPQGSMAASVRRKGW